MPSGLNLLVDHEPPITQLSRMYFEREGFYVQGIVQAHGGRIGVRIAQ
jgi:hypothetical protein